MSGIESQLRAALQAWGASLELASSPQVAVEAPGPGARLGYPHVGLSFGPTTHSHARRISLGVVDVASRAQGLFLLVLPAGAAADKVPAGTRITVTETGLAYDTLNDAWCLTQTYQGEPTAATVVEARAALAGATSNIATVHEYIPVTGDALGEGAVILLPVAIANGSDAAGEAQVWLNGYDSTDAAFKLRAADAESAQALASQWRAAFAKAAAESNLDDSPVLHVLVNLGIAGREPEVCKVYLTGEVSQPDPQETIKGGPHEVSIAARIAYPRIDVESAESATGLMTISVSVNGVEVDVPDPEEA